MHTDKLRERSKPTRYFQRKEIRGVKRALP